MLLFSKLKREIRYFYGNSGKKIQNSFRKKSLGMMKQVLDLFHMLQYLYLMEVKKIYLMMKIQNFINNWLKFLIQKVNQDEFYNLGYKNIYVVITRIDIFEKQINEKYKSLNESERNNILNTSKDLKIEKIIEILGIQRSNIYFVENYHSNMDLNLVDIDHQALKILSDLLNACEQYILFYLNYNASCFAKCF